MPSVPDTSHLPWWLGPSESPGDAMIKGIQAGSMIRSNQIRTQQMMLESEQNARREETATQLKMMDLSLEADRNSLSKQAFQVKQDTQMLQKQGMLSIGSLVSQHIKDERLTDPAARAEFYNEASKWAPFIPEGTVDKIDDNTYGAAIKRKEMAGRIGAAPTLIQYDKYAKELEDQASQIEGLYPDDEDQLAEAKSLRERAAGLKSGSHINAPTEGPPRTGIMTFENGQTLPYYLDNKGKPVAVKPPHDNLSDFQKMEYANELSVLKYKFEKEAFDPSEKLDKNEKDSVTYNRLFKELTQKYAAKAATKPDASKSGPAGPSFDDFLQWKAK